MPDVRQRMHDDLPGAMKARDTPRVAVLRTALGAIANAEAVDASATTTRAGLLGDVARAELSDDDVRAIVTSERDDLLDHARQMDELGQADRAAELNTQAAILEAYL